MKKVYLMIAVMLVSSVAFSQIFAGKAVVSGTKQLPEMSFSNPKTPTDTAGVTAGWLPTFAQSGTVTTITYTGGGYVYGNNADGVDECAQGYVYTGSIGIEGCLMLFCAKWESGANSNLVVKAWSMSTTPGAVNDPANTIGPKTMLQSVNLPIADADTNFGYYTYVAFPAVAGTTNDFCCSVDFSALTANGDTAGLFGDTDGDAAQLDYAFHKYNGTWYVSDYAFSGLDYNIAIFPIVDINYVGIESPNYFYGMKSNAYPSPASQDLTIEYALENNSEVSIEIVDIRGNIVTTIEEGSQAAGLHKVVYNVNDLASGQYFYSIIANGNRLTKKFVVE